MTAYTGKNKEHYFETDLATVQTNVSQPSFHRTNLGIFTGIVVVINTVFEIPQNSFK
jgi:hypothetical protein